MQDKQGCLVQHDASFDQVLCPGFVCLPIKLGLESFLILHW